jgi:hypothetical protein
MLYAAELQAALGNRAEAIRFLERVPKTKNSPINLSEDLVGLIGSDTALRLYRNAGGTRPHILLKAAAQEPDPVRSTKYLDQAFEASTARSPWPDFEFMERTVRHSAKLGHHDQALNLAREMARQTHIKPAAFPVFPQIFAARAMMAAGAEELEVRQILDLAESSFPQNAGKVVGFGLVSGPIMWGNSGLDAEARREIANLRARLGDLDTARGMMDGLENPVFAWNDMLTPDIPTGHINSLLETAQTVLTVEEYAYVRAQLAASISRSVATEAQVEWAQNEAQDILQTDLLSGEWAVSIYTSVARVGASQQDKGLERAALDRLAQAALKSRSFNDLIQAGFEWHRSERF